MSLTRAGERRRIVTIRAMTRTPDGMGGYTESPTDIAVVRAKVEPLEGDEQLRAMQTGMEKPHRFTILYRAGVTGATQLLYDGREFDVKSVIDPDARHRDLVILADEVA